MNKLNKMGVGNTPPLPKQTKPVLAEDYNKVVDGINLLVDNLVEFSSVTTTAYIPSLTDLNKYIIVRNTDAVTITIPTNSSVPFSIGSVITFEQSGAGTITIGGDTGVTINGNRSSGGQYMILVLVKTAENIWTCIGGI